MEGKILIEFYLKQHAHCDMEKNMIFLLELSKKDRLKHSSEFRWAGQEGASSNRLRRHLKSKIILRL